MDYTKLPKPHIEKVAPTGKRRITKKAIAKAVKIIEEAKAIREAHGITF